MLHETAHAQHFLPHGEVSFPTHSITTGQARAGPKDASEVSHTELNSSPDVSTTDDNETIASSRPLVTEARGNYLHLADGRKILDACGGAAVACLGHGVKEVIDAMVAQANDVSYVPWGFFDNKSKLELSNWLSMNSGGHFQKIWITCSGRSRIRPAQSLP
jgi:adenosylmethionine-8-amino-7-oxononanoate aminotransferase